MSYLHLEHPDEFLQQHASRLERHSRNHMIIIPAPGRNRLLYHCLPIVIDAIVYGFNYA